MFCCMFMYVVYAFCTCVLHSDQLHVARSPCSALQAKDHGVFPKWYCQDAYAVSEAQHRQEVDNILRDRQVLNTRTAHRQLQQKLARSYDMEAALRAARNQGAKIERRMDGELFYNTKMVNLMQRVKESDHKDAARALAAEMKQRDATAQETTRLNQIVAANRQANPEKWADAP